MKYSTIMFIGLMNDDNTSLKVEGDRNDTVDKIKQLMNGDKDYLEVTSFTGDTLIVSKDVIDKYPILVSNIHSKNEDKSTPEESKAGKDKIEAAMSHILSDDEGVNMTCEMLEHKILIDDIRDDIKLKIKDSIKELKTTSDIEVRKIALDKAMKLTQHKRFEKEIKDKSGMILDLYVSATGFVIDENKQVIDWNPIDTDMASKHFINKHLNPETNPDNGVDFKDLLNELDN